MQPGVAFEDARFRNTWNAVYLDGSWRFVQCNWGARHLVYVSLNIDTEGIANNVLLRTIRRFQHSRNAKESSYEQRSDGNLRYEYDDHYFMTDPEVSDRRRETVGNAGFIAGVHLRVLPRGSCMAASAAATLTQAV